MYELVTGPLAWASFGIFFVGVLVRAALYIKGLDWQLDRVAYSKYPAEGARGAAKSIAFWLVPFGSRGWRSYPVFTLFFFILHLGLLFTPIFLESHVLFFQERFGWGIWSISETFADVLTLGVIIAAAFMVIRRIALPEVRIITSWYDYLVLLIAAAPFITGFMAAHHLGGDYKTWLIAHILSGELWLVAIPFTKLSHFILFFMSRAQIGMDYGIKRGGMKGRGICW